MPQFFLFLTLHRSGRSSDYSWIALSKHRFEPVVNQCCRNPVFWGDTEYYGDLLLCNMQAFKK